MSFWIDVTTAVSCPPRRGYRVESEPGAAIVRARRDVHLCFYEAQSARFSELPLDEFMRIRQLLQSARAPTEPIGLQVLRHDRSPTGGMRYSTAAMCSSPVGSIGNRTSAIWAASTNCGSGSGFASSRRVTTLFRSCSLTSCPAWTGRSSLLAGHGSSRRSRSLHFTLHQAGSAALDKHPGERIPKRASSRWIRVAGPLR